MLKNNLAVLLAEKQLKITKVSDDTNLSRTTLTALSQNKSLRIDIETLDTLCVYLGVSIAEFFDFYQFKITSNLEMIDIEISYDNFEDSSPTNIKDYFLSDCNFYLEINAFGYKNVNSKMIFKGSIFDGASILLTPKTTEKVDTFTNWWNSIPKNLRVIEQEKITYLISKEIANKIVQKVTDVQEKDGKEFIDNFTINIFSKFLDYEKPIQQAPFFEDDSDNLIF